MTAITDISLSSTTVSSRSGAGIDFANVTVSLSDSSVFSGTVTLGGADAGEFLVHVHADGAIRLHTSVLALPQGQYNITLTATEPGLTNSPFSAPFVITARDPVQHQDVPPIPFPRVDAPMVNEQSQIIEPWTRFMLNVWSQSNGSPFVLNSNFGVPDVPPAGQIVTYVDPADGGYKVVFPSGKIVTLGMP